MRKAAELRHRILSAVLAAALLFAGMDPAALAAHAEGTAVHINSGEELVLLAEQCQEESFSTGKTFYLESDLDLSEYENLFLPVMNGVFEGNGHTILGVKLNEEVSDYGLFRYVGQEGEIRNLTVEAEIVSGEEQENVGILAGSNSGRIVNCVSRGTVNGYTAVGGIAGINEETGKISRCANEAEINGRSRTGGIAGSNEGVIEDCTNAGSINTSQKILKEADGDGSVAISLPNAVAGVTYDQRANQTGGIAGSSTGSISYCKNQGTIGHEHLGYSTGGIVGKQEGSVSYCSNEGTVYGRKQTGGITGNLEPYEAASYDRDISQELSDQLDELSDMMDDLGDAGDNLGDHLSDNLDTLSDQMKALRDSLRGWIDDLGDLADDSKDDIGDQVGEVKDALEKVRFDFDAEKISGYIAQMEKDMEELRKTLTDLEPLVISYSGEAKAELQSTIEKYSAQLQEAEELIRTLEQYIQNMGGQPGAGDAGTAGDGSSSETENGDASQEQQKTEEPSGSVPEKGTEGGTAESGNGSEETGGSSEDAEKENESGTPGESTPSEKAEQTAGTQSGSGSAEEESPSGTPEDAEEPKDTDTGSEASGSGDSLEEHQETETDGSGEERGENPEKETPSASSEPEPEEDKEDSGRMVPMAYTDGSVTVNQSMEIASGLAKLQEIGADLSAQMSGIVSVLEELPGKTEELRERLRDFQAELSDLSDTVDGQLDDWEDELGDMKDELRSRGDGLSDSMEHTSDTLETDLDAVTDQLDRIKDQFSVIRGTISDAFDEIRDRIEDRSVYADISDSATREPGDGKIVSCTNSGEIISDSEAGGIVGSIVKAAASDAADWFFDSDQEDEEEEDDSKDSITRHVLAAIWNCKNTGGISIKDDYAGGIVGLADYGAVFSGESYGDVISEDGSYVGGIAGKTKRGIYDSYVLCGLNGASYVGGVAGEGEDISGSYVCVYMDMEDYVKSAGAVAGKAEGTVENNCFVDNGYGAVDGVTRSSEAEAMNYETLLTRTELPGDFTEFTIRFMDGDRVVWQENFSYGEELSEEEYPGLTAQESEYAYWEEKDVSPVRRNVTVHAVRRTYVPSLSSDDGDGRPSVLLGGEFYPDSELAVQKVSDDEAAEVEKAVQELFPSGEYTLRQAFRYSITQSEKLNAQMTVRVEHGTYPEDSLLTLTDDFQASGTVQKAETVGGYLSARTELSDSGYIIVLDQKEKEVPIILGVTALLLALALFGIWQRRKKRNAAAGQKEQEETPGDGGSDS